MQKLWSTEVGGVFLESFYFWVFQFFGVSFLGNLFSLFARPSLFSLPTSPSRPPFAGFVHGRPATSGHEAGPVLLTSGPPSKPDQPWCPSPPETPGISLDMADGDHVCNRSGPSRFRPNWPEYLWGSGSPRPGEPSATSPDQIRRRTAAERVTFSGDPAGFRGSFRPFPVTF